MGLPRFEDSMGIRLMKLPPSFKLLFSITVFTFFTATFMKLYRMKSLKNPLSCFHGLLTSKKRITEQAHERRTREDSKEIVKREEEDKDTHTQISHHQQDNQKNPISVEQYDDELLLRWAIAESLGFEFDPDVMDLEANQKNPISVEQYDDELLLRWAIAESLGFEFDPDAIDLDEFEGLGEDPDDQKGKKPIETRRSSSVRIAPESYCTICTEPKWEFELFHMKGCSHMYCSCCISQYVAVKIQENLTSIRCPDPGCKDGFLEPEMCRLILPPDVFDRWGSALCESSIGSMKFYCPYKDCSALLIDERGGTREVIKETKCPHCVRLFCAQCRVPWHVGLTCKKYQKLGADEKGQEDVMLMNLARNCRWQRCPKCKFYVERIDGCMFMICRCGYCFCYGCASPMTKSHYCSKCKR